MSVPAARGRAAFRGAIFDLDGVLIDTVPLHRRAWTTAFAARGIAFDEAAYLAKVDGRTLREGARAMMPDADEGTVAAVADDKRAVMASLLDAHLPVFDSSIALVHRLREAGIRLAVASGSAEARALLERAGIVECFGAVVGGADVARGKPHPEGFLAAARGLGLAPGECVVFEDSASGVRAAGRGGFHCVGVDRGGRPGRLGAADRTVADLSELDLGTLFGIAPSP